MKLNTLTHIWEKHICYWAETERWKQRFAEIAAWILQNQESDFIAITKKLTLEETLSEMKTHKFQVPSPYLWAYLISKCKTFRELIILNEVVAIPRTKDILITTILILLKTDEIESIKKISVLQNLLGELKDIINTKRIEKNTTKEQMKHELNLRFDKILRNPHLDLSLKDLIIKFIEWC